MLKHTNIVSNASYQPSRLGEDLTEATFSEQSTNNDSPRFAFLRDISMPRDPNTPFELAPNDLIDFAKRTDMSNHVTASLLIFWLNIDNYIYIYRPQELNTKNYRCSGYCT